VKRTQGGETIIGEGLKAGESVVVDGTPRLVAGAKVEVRRPGRPGDASPQRGPGSPRGPAPAPGAPAPGQKSGEKKGA
jgi:membrane fusion protein, multidrug efflux system